MKQWSEFSFILKPSALGGIGVFITHDIANGMQVFSGKYCLRKALIEDIPEEFRRYCIYINEEECFCPERFDRIEMGWFINHSHQPNIKKIADNCIITTREIKAGEEILIDYNQLNEPEHLKEDYYRK